MDEKKSLSDEMKEAAEKAFGDKGGASGESPTQPINPTSKSPSTPPIEQKFEQSFEGVSVGDQATLNLPCGVILDGQMFPTVTVKAMTGKTRK